MADSKGKYSLIYQMLGAAKVAAGNRKVAASMNRVLNMSQRLRAGMLGMSTALAGTGAALVALGMAARRVVSAYGDYTIAQSRIRTTLAAQLPNYRAVNRVVGQHADMVGRRLGYSLTESNEAMMTMLQTGLETHRAMRVFGTSMQLARVADMDTANATRFLTDTMNMFRTEAGNANEEVQHFARRMASQLAVAANMASTDIESLQQAFRYAGGEMSTLGFESQDVMAALAALSSVGLRSTTAGTRLRGAIAALHTPSQTTLDYFKQFNIEGPELEQTFYNADGSIRPLGEGMDRLGSLFRRLPTDLARNTALNRLFGRRALAAGAAVTQLSEAGDRFASIRERLGERDISEGLILDRMAEERTRSFGFQVQQLKEGITDLGIAFGEILFGAMDETGEGFGTHIRQVAAAIRLSGDLENMTAAQRREWEALSPEVRESGQRYRELFVNLADVLKHTADFMRWIAGIANEYPQATAGVIGLTVAVGGLGPIFTGVLSLAGAILKWFGVGLVTTTGGIYALIIGIALLATAISNRLLPMLTGGLESFFGISEAMDAFREGNDYINTSMLEGIPIVGNYLKFFADMLNALIGIVDVITGNRSIWSWITGRNTPEERQSRREFGTADDQIQARLQTMRGSSVYANRSDEELHAMATMEERSRSRIRLSTLLGARGITGEEGISSYLRSGPGGGMGRAQSTRLAGELARVQRGILSQGRETVWQQARQMSEAAGGMTAASAQTARQLAGLEEASVRARNALNSISSDPMHGLEGDTGGLQSIPSVNDAYVGRGGLLRAASGDVVVSREHLARAVSARRGAMVGSAMGEGVGDRTMTGPQASSGGGGGGGIAEVTVPVMLDGTEIARAVGRAHIRHLERSGSSFSPGQRRTMRETGFTERLG